MTWRKFFLSKKPDGRPTAGLGIYLLFIGLPFLVFVGFMMSGGPVKEEKIRGEGVKAPRLEAAIRSTAPIEQPDPAPVLKSERDLKGVTEAPPKVAAAKPPPPVVAGNALEQAVQEAQQLERERPAMDENGRLPGEVAISDGQSHVTMVDDTEPAGRLGRLGPNVGGGNLGSNTRSNPRPEESTSIDALVVYHRKRHPKPPEPAAKPTSAADPWASGKFLPRASRIPLYLMDTIRTNSPQPIIRCAVQRDVKFHGKVVIPFGAMVLLTVSSGGDSGFRIVADPSSLQFIDGSEVAVTGAIRGEDGSVGIPAYYVPPDAEKMVQQRANEFIAGYLATVYAERARNASLSIGGVSLSTNTSTQFDPRYEGISVASSVFQSSANWQLKELQTRYAAHLVALPGTKCELILTAPLTLTKKGMDLAPMPAPQTADQGSSKLPKAVQDALGGIAGSGAVSELNKEMSAAAAALGKGR